MKKISFQTLRNKSIQTKLYIFFIILIILPLTFLGAGISVLTRNLLTEQIQKSALQYINQSVQSIENTLGELDSIVVSNLWNVNLQNYLNEPVEYISSPEEKRQINSILRSIANARQDIEYLVLEKNSGEKFIYSSRTEIIDYEKYLSIFREEAMALSQERFDAGKSVWYALPQEPDYVLGVKRIYDFESLEELGWIYVFFKEDTILRQYEDLKTTENSFFVVNDEFGAIVSENATDYISADAADSSSKSSKQETDSQLSIGQEETLLSNNGYITQTQEADSLGWSITAFTPKAEIMRPIYRFQWTIVSIIAVLIGILLLIMRRFARSLTNPIENLTQKMQEVRNENFNVSVEYQSDDEIGELSETFNLMTDRMKHLIEEDYKSRILIRETEFKFLRAQINPHFLYNTLDSISWMAAMGGNQDVSDMAVALGRILRWSISNTDDVVPLKEEAANVEDYLSIQQIRFGEDLTYTIDMEEDSLNWMVPKIILQPLVENALVHGLEPKPGEKNIRISAEAAGDELVLTVCDNGVGIDQEKLEQIRAGKVRHQGQHGVGLNNVRKRIQMYYGDDRLFQIDSKVGEGTEIRVIIPENTGRQENASEE